MCHVLLQKTKEPSNINKIKCFFIQYDMKLTEFSQTKTNDKLETIVLHVLP